MKILLIESPWNSVLVDGSTRKLPPLGIGYLCSAIKQSGHNCIVLDTTEFVDSHTNLKPTLEKYVNEDIGIIGISATTDTFLKGVEIGKIARTIFDGVPIILGGCHATVTGGDRILKYWSDVFDYVLEGEGEISFIEFIDTIVRKENPANVAGLSWKQNGKIFRNDYKIIRNLDDIPFPDRLSIVAPTNYALHDYGLDVSIMTSRGCSHKCSFCSVTEFFKHSWRIRSIDNVLKEIDDIVQYYGDNVFLHFVDDNFFVDPFRSFSIIEHVHFKYPNMHFSFATRSDQVIRGEKYLSKLKEYGCISIELGIENGSQEVLDRFNKEISVSENLKALSILNDYGIDASVDYIMFDHYTTIKDLLENIVFLKESGLWGNYPQLTYSSLVLYPGTKSSELWVENGNGPISYDRGMPCSFKYPTVEKIYGVISEFDKHQSEIFRLLEKCARITKKEQSGVLSKVKISAGRLKLLPYRLFEKVVKLASQNWDETIAKSFLSSSTNELQELKEELSRV